MKEKPPRLQAASLLLATRNLFPSCHSQLIFFVGAEKRDFYFFSDRLLWAWKTAFFYKSLHIGSCLNFLVCTNVLDLFCKLLLDCFLFFSIFFSLFTICPLCFHNCFFFLFFFYFRCHWLFTFFVFFFFRLPACYVCCALFLFAFLLYIPFFASVFFGLSVFFLVCILSHVLLFCLIFSCWLVCFPIYLNSWFAICFSSALCMPVSPTDVEKRPWRSRKEKDLSGFQKNPGSLQDVSRPRKKTAQNSV